MKEYLDLLHGVRKSGRLRADRTRVGTLSLFGTQSRYDLTLGFPAVTTKKLFFRGVKEELLWMLRGETNVRPLQEAGVHIWDEWADDNGDLGPVYGEQWRDWLGGFDVPRLDQIKALVWGLTNSPFSRRHILTAWNPAELDHMALAPCHVMAQFYVHDGRLSCMMTQRSADLFLGAPFNIAQYALLTHMLAQVTGHGVGELIHSIGDAHIYRNHLDQVDEQLSREPLRRPTLALNPVVTDIDRFMPDDIALGGYQHHPKITAPVAV